MPGSPVMTAYDGTPARRPSTTSTSDSRSASRPTIGHGRDLLGRRVRRRRRWRRPARRPGPAPPSRRPARPTRAPGPGAAPRSAGRAARPTARARAPRRAPRGPCGAPSSASACRPERVSASACSAHSRSRSGWAAVSASTSAATVAWWPSARLATARSSSATRRSSSSRARSATAASASPSSAYGVPRHSASASSRRRDLGGQLGGVERGRPPAERLEPRCAPRDGLLEAVDVHALVGHPERVPGRHRHQHRRRRPALPVRLHHPAQLRDVGLEGRGHTRRRGVLPEQVHDPVDGDRPAARERERGDQRPLLGCAEIDRRSGQAHLDRTEDGHLHAHSLGSGRARRAPSRIKVGSKCRLGMVIPPITPTKESPP